MDSNYMDFDFLFVFHTRGMLARWSTHVTWMTHFHKCPTSWTNTHAVSAKYWGNLSIWSGIISLYISCILMIWPMSKTFHTCLPADAYSACWHTNGNWQKKKRERESYELSCFYHAWIIVNRTWRGYEVSATPSTGGNIFSCSRVSLHFQSCHTNGI